MEINSLSNTRVEPIPSGNLNQNYDGLNRDGRDRDAETIRFKNAYESGKGGIIDIYA